MIRFPIKTLEKLKVFERIEEKFLKGLFQEEFNVIDCKAIL